jgi:stage III sporulation protein AC
MEAVTMGIDISTIFQIAGIGIIVAMIHTVLKQMGKEDMAQWVTLIGFVVVLFMVVRMLNDLFQEIKTIFLFQ